MALPKSRFNMASAVKVTNPEEEEDPKKKAMKRRAQLKPQSENETQESQIVNNRKKVTY